MENKITQKLLLLGELFWVFFKIGPSTFGGGYAMMAVIEQEVAGKRKWMDESEMSDLLSIAGSAPGGVGVNASAFIGYRLGKIPGAAAAVLGITLPTFLIVYVLSFFYSYLQEVPKVQAAMKGINGAVLGFIGAAAYRMAKSALVDWSTLAAAAGSLAVLLLTGWNPIFMILAGLGLGIIIVRAKKWLGLKVVTEKTSSSGQAETGVIEYYI
ncbi:chromate transporter [Paenibacillus pinistramenti]|uniref:chromate transporter n=1 Tax=Paenibacillus pinistramenti TaxID=1768003 RepID=UPI0011083924|nr:chromate transporter [Paenibacillus pinistramenti]